MKKPKHRIHWVKIVAAILLSAASFSPWIAMPSDDPVIHAEARSYETYDSPYTPYSDLTSGISTPDQNRIYVIETAEDLYQFSQACYGSQKSTYLSLDYVLGDDIDYSDASRFGRFFRPVGFFPNPSPDPQKTDVQNQAEGPFAFQGTFDGQGFEIHNLLIESISLADYQSVYANVLQYYAMFSVIGVSGVVKNLGIVNPIMVQPINHGILTGASMLAGINHGSISYVSVVDNRTPENAGMNVNGNYRLAGIVVVNRGFLTDSFVASARIRAQSVTQNLSTRHVFTENYGTISRLYFDATITEHVPDASETAHALSTTAFQTRANFSSDWFLNGDYLTANRPNYTYPVLRGFLRSGSAHYVRRAADLVYLSRVIDKTWSYNNINYQLYNDIDMASVSRIAMATPITNYANIFQSRLISTNPTGILFTRTAEDNAYFAILNLSLPRGSDLGAYAGFGWFGSVSGTIRDLNLFNVRFPMTNQASFSAESYLSAGVVAARLNNGTLNNVKVHLAAGIAGNLSTTLYLGGLVGSGNGTITNSSTQGSIDAGVHPFLSAHVNSSVGGLIGFAGIPGGAASLVLTMSNSINYAQLTGLSFTGTPSGYVNLGGLVGMGSMASFINVENRGNLVSQQADGLVSGVSMGGIIGYQTNMSTNNTSVVRNYGGLELVVNRSLKARVGVGYGVGANVLSTSARTYANISNYGDFAMTIPAGTDFTENQLAAMDIIVAGVVVSHYLSSTFSGVYNYANFDIDLSFVRQFAAINVANHNFTTGTIVDWRDYYDNYGANSVGSSTLQNAVNYGNVTATTSRPVYFHQLKVSGVALGKQVSYFKLRNEGNLSVTIDHDAPYALDSMPTGTDNISPNRKNVIVTGVVEQVLGSRRGDTLYNHGTITVASNPAAVVRFHLFVSGVVHRNRNTTTTSTGTITRMLVNDGAIVVDWNAQGNVIASGLVAMNNGSIQTGMNLGDVYVQAQLWSNPTGTASDDFLADAAGIAGRMDGTASSGQIINSVNYGNIHAQSTSGNGRTSSGGLIARNNRRDNHLPISSSSFAYHNQQVRYSINYGDISSWNTRTETFQVKDLAYSIAGGIIANGFMRIDTTINYGHVYSNTLAGGIVGHLAIFDFAQYTTTTSVFMNNLINYGDVRKLTSSGATFTTEDGITIDSSVISNALTRNGNQAYGGIIGNIHVGTGNWAFASGNYSFTAARYQHWLNADDLTDAVGTIPPVTANNDAVANALAATVYAIKDDDTSPYPYLQVRSFNLTADAHGSGDGFNGTDYSGIFDASFAFMAPATATPAIANYIKFIPTNRVNNYLLTKIGFLFDPNDETRGIFALGPSSGIGEEGLYLPDNFNVNEWNPPNNDASWQYDTHSGGRSFAQKIGIGMKQLSKSLATNIDRIQAVDNLTAPTLRLNNPIIDKVNYTITFYVADNSAYAADPNRTVASQTIYALAGPAYVANGAYLDGSVWRGTHVWNGSAYVSQAGGTHVSMTVNVVSSPTPRSFLINTNESSTYTLGYRATFFYETGNPATGINLPSTIQNVYGAYPTDGVFTDASGNTVSSIAMHAGTVRVYAEAYDPIDQDPLTFRDYSVRIVRLPGTQFTDATTGSVNGTAIDLSSPGDQGNVDLRSIEAFFKPTPLPNGQVAVTFATSNMPFGETPHLAVELRSAAGTLVTLSGNYTFTATNNQTLGNQSASTGVWGNSTAVYVFTLQQALASGEYYFRIRIDQTQEAIVRFVKRVSDDNLITAITSTGFTITASGTNWVSDIPYGLYYNPLDSSNTRLVNFTNLPSILNVTAANANLTANRPSYLTSITLSPYSTLLSVSVVLEETLVSGYLHRYVVTYQIRSESGIDSTITHTITERLIPSDLTAAYKGVNLIETNPEYVEFQREETPFYRYEYATANLYRYLNQGLIATLDYTGSGSPIPSTDYLLAVQSTGMQIDFYASAPVGFYDLSYDYVNSYTYTTAGYPLQGITVDWNIAFEDVALFKVGNSNAHLVDITFSSDFVYSGLNTILHPSVMDDDLYLTLLSNPTMRQIVLIPTIGINYNDTLSLREYYVVGQVADTNLVYYKPDFVAPVGARIVRVHENGDETEILYADFSPVEENEFRYIHYRIYAEDYIEGHPEYGTHVTNYYVAAQDVTNNIYLTIEVHLLSETPIDSAFVSLLLTASNGNQALVTLLTTFEEGIEIGTNLQPRSTTSGTFAITLLLPEGLTFTVEFDDMPQSGSSFVVPETVIPRRYTIRIFIDDAAASDDWGQRQNTIWTPAS